MKFTVNPTLREIATEIANEYLAAAEYSLVYEDEDLYDLSEEEWRQIHDLITHSRAILPTEPANA